MLESSSIPEGSATAFVTAILSALSLVSGPFLVLLALAFYWARRRRPLPPPLFSLPPLALTSVSIQLLNVALLIIRGFQEIAQSQSTGLATVARVFLEAQRSLMRSMMEFGACLILVAVFQVLGRAPAAGSTSGESSKWPVSIATAGWSAGAALAVGLLVWFAADIVQLCIMLVDPAKASEAQARLGNMGLGAVSEMLSTRLTLLALFAISLTFVLVAIACRCLEPGRARPWDRTASAVLAVAVLGWCYASTAGMSRDVQYLQHLIVSSGGTLAADPERASVFSVDRAMDLLFPTPPPPRVDYLIAPPPPPPPPPQ